MLRRHLLQLAAYPALPAMGRKRLTFSDDFTTFDWNATSSTSVRYSTPTGTWATRYWWNDGDRTSPGNAEQQFYSDRAVGADPFAIEDGSLLITARLSHDPANTQGLPYVSGIITTEGTFSQVYGYFEMRAQLPRGQGLWPAFWLLPQDHSWPPEIDIMEVLGHEPTRLFGSIHSTALGAQKSVIRDALVSDLADGFHSFGLSWGPERLVWYVDEQPVFDMPTAPDMHRPMYLLANLAVGGTWPGNPGPGSIFPATMSIDYIRVYQYDGF